MMRICRSDTNTFNMNRLPTPCHLSLPTECGFAGRSVYRLLPCRSLVSELYINKLQPEMRAINLLHEATCEMEQNFSKIWGEA